MMLMLIAHALPTAAPQMHRFTVHQGYIPVGADVANGTMSIEQAKQWCSTLASCEGITFQGNLNKVNQVGSGRFVNKMWLKASGEWTEHGDHVTLLKVQTNCPDTKFMRYKRQGHGPYCCEGKGCPVSISEYEGVEARCRLPAKSVGDGPPACANLRGTPLRNMAIEAVASASSEYPYPENAGVGAANDGVINANIYHSVCDGGQQYWRLKWKQRVALAQVVLHNRKEFKARMYGAALIVRGEGGTVLANTTIRAVRSMYIWTPRPLISDVASLELLTPSEHGCLHFRELEAFGMLQSEAEVTDMSFRELPDPRTTTQRQAAASAAQPPPPPVGETGPKPGIGAASSMDDMASLRATRATPTASSPTRDSPRPNQGRAASAAASPETRDTRKAAGIEPQAAVVSAGVDDDFLWVAATTSFTTLALLSVQFVWVKSRWLDNWQ